MTAADHVENTGAENSAENLSPSLLKLLIELNLKAATNDDKATDEKNGTPDSLQVIQSGALSISSTWGKKLTRVGYAGALTAVIGPFATAIKDYDTVLQVTLIGGGLFVLAAAVIAAALVVAADTKGRAIASAARIEGLGDVTSAFLETYGSPLDIGSTPDTDDVHTKTELEVLAAAAAFPGRLMISCTNEDPKDLVAGIRNWRDGVNLSLTDGTLVRLDEVKWYQVAPPSTVSTGSGMAQPETR